MDEQEQAPPRRRPPLARWVEYRRARVEAELERSRNSRVPTWAMALFLGVFVAAWIAYVALVG
jgi:hypothetical protein